MLKLKKIKTETYDNAGLDKPYLPSVNFDSVQMPEVKDWKVGEEYTVILKIKQTSMSQYKDDKANASFDVVAYKVLEDEDYSDEELEDMQARGLSS